MSEALNHDWTSVDYRTARCGETRPEADVPKLVTQHMEAHKKSVNCPDCIADKERRDALYGAQHREWLDEPMNRMFLS